MKNEKKELKIGDTVVLKSGGPVMTVMCKDDEDEHHFYCGYFYNGEYKEPEFWDNVLEKVEKEYIGCDECELGCDDVYCDICKDIEEKIDEKSQYYNPVISITNKINQYVLYKYKDINEFCIEVAREAYRDGASWMYNELTK